jgi:cytochrome c oxidase assembly protein subunit 15
VAFAAFAAGILAFFRRPFRRDLAILGALLPLGVMGQAVMGGLTVLYGLAPGWVMGHYLLSMTVLVAAGALAWRARPAFERDEPPAADRATARAVWCLFVLGGLTIFVGTAATAAGPHAGGEGTGDVVHRFTFKGSSTVNWLIDRHGVLATLLGLLAVGTWYLARQRGADAELRARLTRVCVLLAVQGVVGIVQFQLDLPAEIVWLHVVLATLLWVGLVLAVLQVGVPRSRRLAGTHGHAVDAHHAQAGGARGAQGRTAVHVERHVGVASGGDADVRGLGAGVRDDGRA